MLPLDDLLKSAELSIWAGESDIPIPMEGMTEREYSQYLRDNIGWASNYNSKPQEKKEDYSK